MFSYIDLIYPIGITFLGMVLCIWAMFREHEREKRTAVYAICSLLVVVLWAGMGGYYYWKYINLPYKNCYSYPYSDVSSFSIKPNLKTKSGIDIDNTSGIDIDLDKIDYRLSSIETCMKDTLLKLSTITKDNLKEWGCTNDFPKDVSIKRNCIIIKVVPAVISPCTTEWQFIGIKAPDAGCLSKGLITTKECPCQWRTVIQGNSVIVTPPAMYLWEIPKLITGCSMLWKSPFAKCLTL